MIRIRLRTEFIRCTLYNSGISYAGIHLYNVDNGTIETNYCFENYYGIYIRYGSNITICGNYVHDNINDGIYDYYGSNNTYLNNKINKNNEFGIYLHYSVNNSLSGNLFTNDGLFIMGSKESLSSYSIDTTNLVNGKPLYYYANKASLTQSNFTNAGQILLANCKDSLISGTNIANTNLGISLYYSNNVSVSDNFLRNNRMGGMFIYLTNNSLISKNTIENSFFGIYVFSCINLTFNENIMNFDGFYIFSSKEMYSSYIIDTTNLVNGKPVYYYVNKVGLTKEDLLNAGQVILANCNDSLISEINTSSTTVGIALYYSHGNKISENVVNENNIYGIFLYSSNNNTISRNIIDHCDVGIYLWSSHNTTILKNSIINNQKYGINFNSNDNKISENLIRHNDGYGILTYGIRNLIYKNYFLENNIHAVDFSGGINYWNSSSIGNYWDNYTGLDANHDGIGDTPHAFSGSTDYLPIVDKISPKIVIKMPLPLEVFGDVAPNFTQVIWNALPDGNITIRFYARDLAQNIVFAEITIIKKTFHAAVPAIPSYNIILLLLGIAFVTTVVILKKKTNPII
ncbi:MAG: NosD domain-containing protein [Promethearchaeota archaeon]